MNRVVRSIEEDIFEVNTRFLDMELSQRRLAWILTLASFIAILSSEVGLDVFFCTLLKIEI